MKKIDFKFSKRQAILFAALIALTGFGAWSANTLSSSEPQASVDSLEHVTEPIPTAETVEECILRANQKYSETIKAHGDTVSLEETTITVMTPEEWHVIDNHRDTDTKACQNNSNN